MAKRQENQYTDNDVFELSQQGDETPTRDENPQPPRREQDQPPVANADDSDLNSYLMNLLDSQDADEYIPEPIDSSVQYNPSRIESTSHANDVDLELASLDPFASTSSKASKGGNSSNKGTISSGMWKKPPQRKAIAGKDLRLLKKTSPTQRKATAPTKPKTPAARAPIATSKGKAHGAASAPSTPQKQTPNPKRFTLRSLSATRSVVFRDGDNSTDGDGPSFHRDDDVPVEIHAKFRLVRMIDFEVGPNHVARPVNEEYKIHRRGGCIDSKAEVKLTMKEFSVTAKCKP